MSGNSDSYKFFDSSSSENLIIPFETHIKKVKVHYWKEYNTGEHIVKDYEINNDTRILEIMQMMVQHINAHQSEQKESSSFIVRKASKKGLPKIDLPAFDMNQRVNSAEFDNFVVCNKTLDERARSIAGKEECIEELKPTTKEILINKKNWCKRNCSIL